MSFSPARNHDRAHSRKSLYDNFPVFEPEAQVHGQGSYGFKRPLGNHDELGAIQHALEKLSETLEEKNLA